MKYKVGDKVALLTKYGNIDTYKSSAVCRILKNSNQKYAYITEIDEKNYRYLINEVPDVASGDYFLETDIKLYIQEERKLKLKKINESRR